jgi:hypothetical protein
VPRDSRRSSAPRPHDQRPFWDKVIEITSIRQRDVYRVSVADTHNVVAQGVSVRRGSNDARAPNCAVAAVASEQADGEIDELRVAHGKHRNGSNEDEYRGSSAAPVADYQWRNVPAY